MRKVALVLCFGAAAAQPSGALPWDPRHQRDPRCEAAVKLDPAGRVRDPASTSIYLWVPLKRGSTAADCAHACCGDWSCESFAFYEATAAPAVGRANSLAGEWQDHDSLRGVGRMSITQIGSSLAAKTENCQAMTGWATAAGHLGADGKSGWWSFDGSSSNNRTFELSADGNTISLARVGFDPEGFAQSFTRALAPWGPDGGGVCSACTTDAPCCAFKVSQPVLHTSSLTHLLARRQGAALDLPSGRPAASLPRCITSAHASARLSSQDDIDALVDAPAGVVTGVRAKLPSRPPPYPTSTAVAATLNTTMYVGVNGDEFPITWGADGRQYTGAGDNHQKGMDGPRRAPNGTPARATPRRNATAVGAQARRSPSSAWTPGRRRWGATTRPRTTINRRPRAPTCR